MKQGTEEWVNARLGIATASRFSDVMAMLKSGKGEAAVRAQYRAELVIEKLTGKPAESGFMSKAMREGIEREPYAKIAYEDLTGEMIEEVGLIRHPFSNAGRLLMGCSERTAASKSSARQPLRTSRTSGSRPASARPSTSRRSKAE